MEEGGLALSDPEGLALPDLPLPLPLFEFFPEDVPLALPLPLPLFGKDFFKCLSAACEIATGKIRVAPSLRECLTCINVIIVSTPFRSLGRDCTLLDPNHRVWLQ